MRRILLIDDTPEIAELLTFALRDRGYEVFADGLYRQRQRIDPGAARRCAGARLTAYDMSESLFDSVRHTPDHAELPGRHHQRHAGGGRREPSFAERPKSLAGSETIHRGAGCERARPAAGINMPLWSMDEWQYLEREVVTDPKGRQWTVALMDVLGQEGDPDMPNKLLELQYSSGRYFTLIYSDSGALAAGTRLRIASRGDERIWRPGCGRHRWQPRSVATCFPAGSGGLTHRLLLGWR